MALNNNQITEVLASAIEQATGATDIDALDVKGIIDNGTPVGENGFTLTKEKFTGALCDVIIKNWFKDTSYRSAYNDPFFVDSDEFGAYVQAIQMKYPEAENSHAWNDMGSKSDPVTIGTYKVYIPEITSFMFGKTVSYEINISVTGEQWDTAFNSASELNAFVNYIYMMVDNAIVMHLEEMDYLNRNNFIAEKIKYAKSEGAKGIHYINLVSEYNTVFGTSLTKAQFIQKAECIVWAHEYIRLMSDRFTKMSKLFNTEAIDRFTPKERQVLITLADFEAMGDTRTITSLGYTYEQFVSLLPNHITVPYWQGSGESYSLSDTSAINLTCNDETEISQTGIVAILVDKWAVSHTIKKRRTVAKYFEPEDITTMFNQFRDQYSTDLSCNGIIFGLEELAS